MALKMRLARGGSKKQPYYRIVVADSRNPRDGRFIEKVGTYNPMVERDHPDRLRVVEDRVRHWISVGAVPTDRVARFLGDKGLMEKPKFVDGKKSQPKQKAQERLKEQAEKAEKAIAAAAAAKQAEKDAAAAAKEAAKEAAAAPKVEEAPVEEAVPAPAEAAPVAEETAAPAEEAVPAAEEASTE